MEITDITNAVHQDTSVGKSVVTLINRIVEELDASPTKKAMGEIADTLNENANEIADAVIANTLAEPEIAGDPLNRTGEKRTADGQPVEPPPSEDN